MIFPILPSPTSSFALMAAGKNLYCRAICVITPHSSRTRITSWAFFLLKISSGLFVANFPQPWNKFIRRHNRTAPALDRFQHNSRNLLSSFISYYHVDKICAVAATIRVFHFKRTSVTVGPRSKEEPRRPHPLALITIDFI